MFNNNKYKLLDKINKKLDNKNYQNKKLHKQNKNYQNKNLHKLNKNYIKNSNINPMLKFIYLKSL